jgi:hypothetical protein
MRAILAAIAMLALPAGDAAASCAPKDIEVKPWTMERDAGWFTVSGELVNRCPEATAVQLGLTFRDARGQEVSQEDAWMPARGALKTGETFAFAIRSRGYATAKTVAVRVITVESRPSR